MRGPWKKLAGGSAGAQIVEFAVTVPLLLVFVVGIYDFGQAFNLKEKLNFAARDGARLGATLPTNDLSQDSPASVTAVRDLVDADLRAAGVDDCGLGSIVGSSTVWTAKGTCLNSFQFILTIDRGLVVKPILTASPLVHQISTHVELQYPHQWQFGSLISLFVPAASYGVTVIDTDAVAANQD